MILHMSSIMTAEPKVFSVTDKNGRIITLTLHVGGVANLVLVNGAIPDDEQETLLSHIDAGTWTPETKKRRVQQFGAAFSYKTKRASIPAPPLPHWLDTILVKLEKLKLSPQGGFDQCMINDYPPGAGIAAHCDSIHAFADKIISVSLGCPMWIDFENIKNPILKTRIWLAKGDILYMNNASRYDWKHSIAARKTDECPTNPGRVYKRTRRVSITLRKLLSRPQPQPQPQALP